MRCTLSHRGGGRRALSQRGIGWGVWYRPGLVLGLLPPLPPPFCTAPFPASPLTRHLCPHAHHPHHRPPYDQCGKIFEAAATGVDDPRPGKLNAGVQFYNYYAGLSHTGYEQFETVQLFFVQDDNNDVWITTSAQVWNREHGEKRRETERKERSERRDSPVRDRRRRASCSYSRPPHSFVFPRSPPMPAGPHTPAVSCVLVCPSCARSYFSYPLPPLLVRVPATAASICTRV